MGAKQSAEARHFMQLIRNGWAVARAAAEAGLSPSQGWRIKKQMEAEKKIVTEANEQLDNSDNAS